MLVRPHVRFLHCVFGFRFISQQASCQAVSRIQVGHQQRGVPSGISFNRRIGALI
jgi:hypothetical protein